MHGHTMFAESRFANPGFYIVNRNVPMLALTAVFSLTTAVTSAQTTATPDQQSTSDSMKSDAMHSDAAHQDSMHKELDAERPRAHRL
jgi:hypothetical protein